MSDAKIIYDMPEEEYHKIKALSSSGIKKLLVSAQDFWKWSWMNEDKDEDKSEAFNVGSAYHKRILEGKAAFDNAYAVKPECDRRTKVGKEIYAQFKAEYPDAKEVDQKLKNYIEAAATRIETKPELSKYFTGGKPEVTILWTDDETGVPMKARLDYTHSDMIVDLKTFSNSNDTNLKQLIVSHIARYQYNVQYAVYTEAFKQAFETLPEFYFFFQQSGRDNNTIPVKFNDDLLLAQKGMGDMRKGINKFRDMYEKFNESEWFEPDQTLEFVDEDFPLWAV
jgi:exodeoxyribonuclease VIII